MDETVTMRKTSCAEQNKYKTNQRSPTTLRLLNYDVGDAGFEKRRHFHINYLAGCFWHVVGCPWNRWLTSDVRGTPSDDSSAF